MLIRNFVCALFATESPKIQQQRPEFKVPLSNVMARVGQTIKLECELTGNPKPELSWKLNGKPLSAANAKVSKSGKSIKVYFLAAKSRHNAQQCRPMLVFIFSHVCIAVSNTATNDPSYAYVYVICHTNALKAGVLNL